MTRPRLIVGLAIPIALALAIALVLLTHHEDTSPPPATVAASTTPPTTQPPQDQWLMIIRQIVAERHALYQNPQPELLGRIYDKNGPAYPKEYQTLRALKQQGFRYEDQGIEIRTARVVGRAQGAVGVAIEATTREFPRTLIAGDGRVIRKEPGSPPTKVVYSLIKGDDQRWRIYVVYRPSR
ncbi:MAG TPA: hypothetical protein VGM21_20745 [Actinomycetota bacterium]|jgi:hypothetical protein